MHIWFHKSIILLNFLGTAIDAFMRNSIVLYYKQQLEIRGRAQREAARRRMSDWKDNLGSWNSARTNATWQMRPWNPILEPRGDWRVTSCHVMTRHMSRHVISSQIMSSCYVTLGHVIIIIIIIIIITRTMFMVLSSCLEHCESSPGSFDECSSKRQVAADLWTKPTDLSHRPACSLYRPRQLGNYIHHRHLLLLLSSKADTHFTVPQRVEGWVDLGGWLHTEMVYPSQY